MRQLAFCVGVLVMLCVAAIGFIHFATVVPGQAQASGAVLTLALIVSAFAAAFFVPVGEMAVLVPFVLLARGPNAIGWTSPSGCNGALSWVCFEWDFSGRGGRQAGLRYLGLEVALKGSL